MGILRQLIRELVRRRVFRMTAIYIVAAWVAVQVASEALPALNIPDVAIRQVWLAALIGFPVAIVFSWKFDIASSGIRRTPAAHEDAEATLPLRPVDYGVLAALAAVMLATLLGVGQRLVALQIETGKAPATRLIAPNSIAVLPLASLSSSPDDAYFAAGMHDALITSLSKIAALMVTSRTSVLRVDSELSVPEIGRQLGVSKVLEGSVLMDGDRVRVIVQLIDAASDLHVWAETFEREMIDIISLQNEVARTIADVVEVRLTPHEAASLAKAVPVRPDTYRAYLKGMYQFRQERAEADRRGVEILEQVVRRDPASALAHAGLAYGYAHLGHSPFPGDAYPKARAAAELALELDPELALAHLAMGMYHVYYEWDHATAEKAFKRAISLNPSLTEAHYHLAWLYEILGPEREAESLAAGDRTRELDPLSPFMLGWLAEQYRDACKYDKAVAIAKEAVRLDPDHPIGWLALGQIYVELGKFDEAIAAHGHLAEKPGWAWLLGTTYAAAGLEDKALKVSAGLEQFPGTEFPLALIQARLGASDSALQAIAEVEVKRMPWYPALLGWWPGIEAIAEDPRLKERAATLGLPDPRAMRCGN